MSYEPTINNGGPPVRVWREPVEKPHIIRGEIWIQLGPMDTIHPNGLLTFVALSKCGRFRVTYHETLIPPHRNSELAEIRVVVTSDIVVTWEVLPQQ